MAKRKKPVNNDKNAIKNLRDDINMLDITPSATPNISHPSPIQSAFNHNVEIRINKQLPSNSNHNNNISNYHHLKRVNINYNNNNIMSEDNEQPSIYNNNNNNDRKRGRTDTDKLPQPKKRKISRLRSQKEEEDDDNNEYEAIINLLNQRKMELEEKYERREKKLTKKYNHHITKLQIENEHLKEENKRIKTKLGFLKEILNNDNGTGNIRHSDINNADDSYSEPRSMEELDENDMDGVIVDHNDNNNNNSDNISINLLNGFAHNAANNKPESNETVIPRTKTDNMNNIPALSPLNDNTNHRVLSPAFYGFSHQNNTVSYECSVCGKEFPTKSAVNAHKLSHSTAIQYECKLCGVQFTLKPYYLQHLKTKKHKEKENKSPSNTGFGYKYNEMDGSQSVDF